eukprot:EG_transcript_17814
MNPGKYNVDVFEGTQMELLHLGKHIFAGFMDWLFGVNDWMLWKMFWQWMLWIPVASVITFTVVLLTPGLLCILLPRRLQEVMNAVLCFRPFPPRQRRWWDAPTLDLALAVRDMQLADFLIAALWVTAVLLMLLSPMGDTPGRICAVAWGIVLLPITKHSIWAGLLGASFERYLKFHRWAARATFVVTLAHLIHQCTLRGLRPLVYTTPDNYGLVSFVLMVVICLLSIGSIRRHAYELFYYSHFLAIPAVAFAMLHSYSVCYAMAPSLALYFIDKAVQSWPSGYTYRIQSVTAFTGGVQLVLSRQGAKLPSEPGQYYFLTLTGISRLQKHPLSVTHFCAESSALTFFVRDMGPGTFS